MMTARRRRPAAPADRTVTPAESSGDARRARPSFAGGDSPIGWQPSVLRPVFYGHRDVSVDDGVPVPLRVFFPSLDGAPGSAEILTPAMPYPLVVFLHGNCDEEGHYHRWHRLPSVLARSGYVVCVPDLPGVRQSDLPSDDAHPDIATVHDVVAWIRDGWEHADLLASDEQLAYVGHSRGALLSGFLQRRMAAAAVVSLSGAWTDVLGLWNDLGVPAFYLWGSHDDDTLFALDGAWSGIPAPKHGAVLADGAHWDYLPAGASPCEAARGPCALIEALSADLCALYLARYLPPAGSEVAADHVIPESLEPPEIERTREQAFFAGGHLQSLDALARDDACGVDITWETGRDDRTFEAEGRVTMLRVHELESGYGPDHDHLDAEVVVQLDTRHGEAFGLPLRLGSRPAVAGAMLAALRRALAADAPVRLGFTMAGPTVRRIHRIEMAE